MRRNAGSVIVAVVDTDSTPVEAPAGSRAWAVAFAAVYETFLWVGERSGLCKQREELLGRSAGRTIEIGAGTGLNLPHYPDDLDGLVLVEPDTAMRRHLARRVARSRPGARLVDAPAEQLPFPDGSFDTVVVTLVLCTVDAPDVALQEIVRVLEADGQLLFIEHVRSESPMLARWQDRLADPVAPLRTRLSLQPRHRRADRGLRIRAGRREQGLMARDAADRATAGQRSSTQDGSSHRGNEAVANGTWNAITRGVDRWITSP